MEIETVTLTSVDGVSLTADVIDRADADTAVVVAHPHPLYGGDRHNHVVDAVWRGVAERGACAIRFDFRGAGGSQGHHEGGEAERLDVVAALDEAARRHPQVPVWLVGYSFGALVVAEVDDPRVSGWVLIAPPLGVASSPTLPRCAHDPRPTMVVVPQHDEFCPPRCVQQYCDGWRHTRTVVLPHATHALIAQGSRLDQLVAEMTEASSSGPTPQQPPT